MKTALPRHDGFSPLMPVWCATPNANGCMHRFFDNSPISPSGKFLAVFQMPFEDREPQPGDVGNIRIVDLESGQNMIVAETCGWEPQLGPNLNWGKTDEELYFNDVDTETWKPFSWKLNPFKGKKTRMEGTVYHASPDGRYLISSDLTATRATQPGYGVRVPPENCNRFRGPSDETGFYLTDTQTGKCKLLVSTKKLLETAGYERLGIDDPSKYDFQGFHSKFNPQSDRLMVSVRWFPLTGNKPGWDMFTHDYFAVRYAWFTLKPDGSDIHLAVGPEEWIKRGHHATWFPDGKRISMNLRIDEKEMRLVEVNYDGTGLKKMHDERLGSGHPTVHPDGIHVLTDAYRGEPVAHEDGTVPLRWINLQTGEETCLARLNTVIKDNLPNVMRCDPHPAWDRSWRYIAFNAMDNGTRRVYIADMEPLLKSQA